jgi:hypothetical protein
MVPTKATWHWQRFATEQKTKGDTKSESQYNDKKESKHHAAYSGATGIAICAAACHGKSSAM